MKDVVIIGCGPAGLSTAMQLERYGIKPLVIEKCSVGGLIRNANCIQNYPGFPDGIAGIEFVELLKNQAELYNIDILFDEVNKLTFGQNKFMVSTSSCEIVSNIVVIASGTTPKKCEDITISSTARKKIFYEIYPMRNFCNKHIGIIGAGDCAFDYSLTLAKSNYLYIFNRSDKVSCLPILWEKVKQNENIRYFSNRKIISLDSENNKLRAIFRRNNDNENFIFDYIVFAIGRMPEIGFLDSSVITQQKRLIAENRLFFAGDVNNGIFRQISIAVGDGVRTAMKIYQNLIGNGK
ncbi:hypothetical protein DRQ33_00545 [bacterium]|nr:MAG: hypothetical protein DRQ33_00545 [bacterium]